MSISKRLLASAKYVEGYNCLADCGTDHAYLPIYAVEAGFVKKAIASDNKMGPITNAKGNIIRASLLREITVKYADGLNYLNKDIDIAAVLGMGGRLITEILEKADKQYLKRLVLGPNSEAKIVRQYLAENKFKIVAEEIVEENDKTYQIIVCEPGEMILSENELEFGPFIVKEKAPEFVNYIRKQLDILKLALPKVKNDTESDKIKERMKTLEEVIS